MTFYQQSSTFSKTTISPHFRRFFFLGLLSEELELLLEDELLSLSLDELDDDDDDELLLSTSLSLSLSAAALACAIILGIFFKCSRRSSVKPPKPMDVKKLIANLTFFGVSRGMMP